MVDFLHKRLQVFVSSTYSDLLTERQAAVEAILSAGHIPAGMELFTSGDESQMEVIKQWIDESDVYLLLLGGRYGSVEPMTGKSYTHLEYDYALASGKPLFACVITEAALDQKVKDFGRTVLETGNVEGLRTFREQVLTKMVKFWDDQKDIKIVVGEALAQFSRRQDLHGWVRPTTKLDVGETLTRLTRREVLQGPRPPVIKPVHLKGPMYESLQPSTKNADLPANRKRYNIIVIGDIVYDKITICEEMQGLNEREYPGGALFVKNFLESDSSINSQANIYGYKVCNIEDKKGQNLYSIEIQKKLNTILLIKQKTGNFEVYRFRGSTQISIIEGCKICMTFPELSRSEGLENIQILVVTDLGTLSSIDSSWIGIREIKSPTNNFVGPTYEWLSQLRIAYDQNKHRCNSSMPWHFVTINNPVVSLFGETIYSCFKYDLANSRKQTKLNPDELQQIQRKTLVVINGDHLSSNLNLPIATQFSIERTAQDFLKELHTNFHLNELGKFEHLIVRFGLLAVVHSYRIKNRRFHRLFFDPKSIYKPKYSTKLSGGVTGTQTLLLDNIIRQLLKLDEEEQKNPYDVAEKIGDGIKLGIVDCRKRYDNGYGKKTSEALEFLGPESIRKTFQDDQNSEKEYSVAGIADERIPLAHPTWSILAQSAEYKLVQAAESIVYFGVDKALNSQKEFPLSEDTKSDLNDRIWSPIGLFGTNNKTMIVLERYELESYRSVQLLMEEVINLKNKSILSIAVFGPPGSGKSFVSERIADSACEASQVTPVLKKINLASINDSNQLIEKLDKAFSEYFQQYELVKSEIEDNKRIKTLQLIIFFDEFDCSNNDKILGWLKTFLPMMQDGEFTTSINTQKSNYSTYHNQPILIFAGGTSHTYSNFSRQDSSGDPEDQLRFAQAKGPDFVSRLRGHIDILGPSKTSEHDEGYVVRRAILLRTAFLNHVRRIDDKESLEEYIYNPFLRAMLTVSRYKHGARSMEAIIAMCAQLPGGKISSASMPTHAQLNMHVDANEFLKIVRSNS